MLRFHPYKWYFREEKENRMAGPLASWGGGRVSTYLKNAYFSMYNTSLSKQL